MRIRASLDKAEVSSSLRPSLQYSWSGSRLRFANGSTATEDADVNALEGVRYGERPGEEFPRALDRQADDDRPGFFWAVLQTVPDESHTDLIEHFLR